ncbi:MAG TPA: TIGR00730 family Rossman fold protein [Verrucomicrobiae bacterium]|nr:TIGR00730 family Rossman fold protein [Verrucomicrobiae bacterium]
MKRVCVFCGSNSGARAVYAAAAALMGEVLAGRDLELVYGGGHIGLMGAVADAVLRGRGHVIGVIPQALVARELAHRGVQDLRVVDSMHERKALMAQLADGFVALPGGFGTLEEFCEVLTWAQLGLHRKPCGILNVEGYYDSLLRQFDLGVSEGFVPMLHREWVLEDANPESLLDKMSAFIPPRTEKWISRRET